YYDFIPLTDKKLAVTLGDVAGKGVSAALLMAKLSSDARFCFLPQPQLARAINVLNDQLCHPPRKTHGVVTLAAVLLDPTTHQATLVSAGHMAPLLYRRADDTVTDAMPQTVAGVPLGILDGTKFNAFSITLEPGDSLLLFTDGVTDAVNLS